MKQTLSAKNKAFWAKSKSEQRIAIAKDVLAALKAQFYRANAGTYFNISVLSHTIEDAPQKLDEVLKLLKKEDAVCEVCGIGACFTSLVKLGNNAETDQFLNAEEIEIYDAIADTDMRPLLRKVFPSSQLTLIECAFEVYIHHEDKDNSASYQKRQKAVSFGEQFDDETDRLIAIMKNIIKNNGTFKP